MRLLLPQSVSGQLSIATYGNGVVVLAMPKSQIGGQRIGHTGSDLRPTTTEEHRRRMEAAHG